MPEPMIRTSDRTVAVLPGGRIPPDHSTLIREGFRTGRLFWASDLVDGDVVVAPVAVRTARDVRPASGPLVPVTVGDVACFVADAMSRHLPNN